MRNIYLQAKIGIFDGLIPAGSIKKCQVWQGWYNEPLSVG